MKYLATIPAVALLIGSPALADPRTKTVTIDNPRFEGEKTIVRDRSAGTYSNDATVTRKSDGAVASSAYDRSRTDNGWVASGSQTGFQGRTRSFDYERQRVRGGFRAEGSATTRNGETYDYRAGRQRKANGYVAGRQVKDSDGNTVFGKRTRTRAVDGKIVRNTQSVREPGFRPKRVKPLRPKTIRSGRRTGR